MRKTKNATLPSKKKTRKSSRTTKKIADKLHSSSPASGTGVASAAALALPKEEELAELAFQKVLEDLGGAEDFQLVKAEVEPEEAEPAAEDVETLPETLEEEVADDHGREIRLPRERSSGEDLLRLYFRDIGKIPLLTDQGVIDIAKRIEKARKKE